MQNVLDQNKALVRRFNDAFILKGDKEVFDEIMAADAINHSAPKGAASGKDGMFYFLEHVLRGGLSDIKVEIFDMLAEYDKVMTRKCISGLHTANFMGIPPTNKVVKINVIDIVRIEGRQYKEHWGITNLEEVITFLSE